MHPFLLARRAPVIAALALAAAAPPSGAQQQVTYPESRKIEHVENFWGARVADPYRWMEDLNNPAVAEWVNSENAVTNQYLASLPMRDHFKARLTELWDYAKVGTPFREGGRLYYRKNSGLQRQFVTYSRASPTGRETLVIDPNSWSADGSLALAGFWPSPTGQHVAYGVSQGGADWRTVHVMDLATTTTLADTVRWLKGGGVSWTRDGKGFFYERFPEPESGKQLQNAITSRFTRVPTTRTGSSMALCRTMDGGCSCTSSRAPPPPTASTSQTSATR